MFNKQTCASVLLKKAFLAKLVVLRDRRVHKATSYLLRHEGKDCASPETGARQQIRRRYLTEAQARRALSEVGDQAATGRFVGRKPVTVEQVCANYLAGRHRLRASSRSKLEYDLKPLRERHSEMPVQLPYRPGNCRIWTKPLLNG